VKSLSQPLQLVQFRVHCLPPEILPPDHESNHPNDREANSKSHHCHYWWNEPILNRPVIVIENHSEPKGVFDNCSADHYLARDVPVAVYRIL
jgi:hypothetical protein